MTENKGAELARLNLKRAPRSQGAASRQGPQTAWVAATEEVSSQLVIQLGGAGFAVKFSDDPEVITHAVTQERTDLVVISDALGSEVVKDIARTIRQLDAGIYVGLILYGSHAVDLHSNSILMNDLDADALLTSADSDEALIGTARRVCNKREPLFRLGLLPDKVAKKIDDLYARMHRVDHFDLLGAAHDIDGETLRETFHQLALDLHPDRHNRLQRMHPPGFQRVMDLYKRMAEAYQILGDENLRRSYLLSLRNPGVGQAADGGSTSRLEKELAMCETEAGRQHVMASMHARGLGDWDQAELGMLKAVESEPANAALGLVLDSIQKVKRLIEH